VLSFGNLLPTHDQLNFGSRTEIFAYNASLSGHRSGYGLRLRLRGSLQWAANGYGAFASLLYNRTPND